MVQTLLKAEVHPQVGSALTEMLRVLLDQHGATFTEPGI